MEQCLSSGNIKGSTPKQGSGILTKMKKKIRSTAQSDRDVTESETTVDHGEETNTQKVNRDLSASNDSLSDISNTEGSGILKKMKKKMISATQSDRDVTESETTVDHGEETNTQKVNRELSASNDSLSDISNTEGSGILKKMKKKLISATQSDRDVTESETTVDHGEETNTQKDRATVHSELSASNDSLSDSSNTEGSGILKKMKQKLRPASTAQDGCVAHGELSASNDSLSDVTNTEGSELLKQMKKNLRPVRSTAQISSDADSVDSLQTLNTTETELELPDNTQRKGGKLVGMFRKPPKPAERSLPVQEKEATPSELSASKDGLPDVNIKEKGDKLTDWFRRSPKPAERTRPAEENESTCSELSANSDSALDVNTKEKGGVFSGMFKKLPKPAGSTQPVQEDESLQSELPADNDKSLDIDAKEKGGMFSGMFKSKAPKSSQDPTPAQESLSKQTELSSSNDSLSDNNSKDKVFGGLFRKIPKERTSTFTSYISDGNQGEEKGRPDNKQIGSDADSVDPLQTLNTTETELEPPDNSQKKGAKLTGLFRKSPKLAENTLAQEDESEDSEPSARDTNLLDPNRKEKGGMFSGMFKSKSPKRPKDPTAAQDNRSAHRDLSDSKDSLCDDKDAMEDESEDSEPSARDTNLLDPNRKEKGGMFSGMFKSKSPKRPKDPTAAQDNRSAHRDLSDSKDSLCDDKDAMEDESEDSEPSARDTNLLDPNRKEKGGMFSGMFKSKSPKRPKDPTAAQDNLSAHRDLSDSKDSLCDNDDTKISSDADSVDPLQTLNTTETELEPPDNSQKKGLKFPGLFRKSPKPAESTQEDESEDSDPSASDTNLLDPNTKEKGGMFSGMFRSKAPKHSLDPTPPRISMDTESGTLAGGDEKMEKVSRRKRKVSFRVKRTLPRIPKITFQSTIQDADEEELQEQSFEMVELPSVQESSVEVQMVEMAPLPSETDILDSTEEDDDGLLDWWRTVEGWNEWNESSNFQEDEEELAIEQAADRVYLGAQLFVRLFNQRGASLQKRILELLTLADEADNFHKRALQASMGGRVASVVGSVTTITGLILAPFTFGSSIIVTAVGIGVATAGTITSASAHITDSVHFTLDRKKVEKMIEGYQEEIKDIQECMEFVQEGMHTLQGWNFEKYADSVAKRALNRNIKHVVKEGARAGKALMINTDKLISTVQVLSVAGGAAKAAQAISVTTGVMSALFLALDIFFLAKDSHDLRKGAKTKFAKKLREVCKELQDGLLELNRVKTALQKTMDGIEVEEFEEEEEEEEDEEDEDLECDPEKLAQLEEEINQIEQKLDQEVLEKKKEGEGEGKNALGKDSKEDNIKPQRGKMEKSEEKLGSVKEEGEVRAEKKGKVESEGGKSGISEMSRVGTQKDVIEERKKEKREGNIKVEKKREENEQGKTRKKEGGEHSGKEQRKEDEWEKKAKVGRDEQTKKDVKERDEQRSRKKEGDEHGRKDWREEDEQGRKAKIEWDEQRKKVIERDEQWKEAKRDSIPLPARPRSKAISHGAEETRWEGSDTDPKAPPPARHKRRVSQREPLSI